MKDLKKWGLALLASFMLVGVASGCSSNQQKTDTNPQQNQDNGSSGSQNNGSDQSQNNGSDQDSGQTGK
jgi:uncharacterized protein YcfL